MSRRRALPAVLALLASSALVAPGRAGEPEPAPAHAVRLPAVEPLVLPSGVRLFLLPDPAVPLVTVHVRLPGGIVHDDAAHAGRAALLAAWAGRGAGDLDAAAFRKAVESRGGTLHVGAAARWIALDAEFLAEDQARGLALVRDVLERPRFDDGELAKARDLALEAIRRAHTQPSEAIGPCWDAWLFGAHPYGNPPRGDAASLAAVADAESLRARWREVAAASNRWVAVTGDLDREVVLARLAGTGTHAPTPPPAVAPATPRKAGVLLVDDPHATQTHLRVGGGSFPRTDPDHAARYLANTILGGRFTSRLNTALRVRSGLTYGARSSFDDERGGAFAIATYTATDKSKACVDLARATYADFLAKGVTADELASARAWIEGRFALYGLETRAQQAAWLLDLGISGIPRDFVDGFFGRLDALTVAQVNRVIAARFPKEPLVWTLVGSAEALEPLATSLGEVTRSRMADPGFGPR